MSKHMLSDVRDSHTGYRGGLAEVLDCDERSGPDRSPLTVSIHMIIMYVNANLLLLGDKRKKPASVPCK